MSPKSARICGQAPINPHKPPCFTPQKGKIGFSDVKLEKKSRKNLQNPKNRINFALANGTIASPTKKNDSVAQLVEQMTLNHWVVSSSLTGVTKGSIRPMNSSENQRFSEVFLFTPCPVSAQNIEVAGVQEGYRKFCTRNCTLLGLYFAIFQYVAMNTSCEGCTLLAHGEGAVVRWERRYIKSLNAG